MASGPWSLTAEQRAETVSRIRANMASMAFFRNTPMSEESLTEESRKLEAKAYAAAQVSGTVTTGHRPHEETLQVLVWEDRGRAWGVGRLEGAIFSSFRSLFS